MTIVPLSRAIEAHGSKVTELTLNEPTLGLLDDINIEITGDGNIRFNTAEIKKIISKLAGIPTSSVDQIALKDLGVLGKSVAEFFEEFLPTGE